MMKMKRVSAFVCALAMSLSTAYSVLPQQGVFASQEVSYSYDDYYEAYEIKNAKSYLSDSAGMFVVDYNNNDDWNKFRVSINYRNSDSENYCSLRYNLSYSGEGQLRIYVSDILDAMKEDTVDVDISDYDITICFNTDDDFDKNVKKVTYYKGSETAGFNGFKGDADYYFSHYNILYDEEDTLTIKYDAPYSGGKMQLWLYDEETGDKYFIDVPVEQGTGKEASVKVSQMRSMLKKYDNGKAVAANVTDASLLSTEYIKTSGGCLLKSAEWTVAGNEIGYKERDCYELDTLSSAGKGAVRIIYNSPVKNNNGIKLQVTDEDGEKELYIPVEVNENGVAYVDNDMLNSSLKMAGIVKPLNDLYEARLIGLNGVRIRECQYITEMEYKGVTSYQLEDISPAYLGEDKVSISLNYTSPSAGEYLFVEYYDAFGGHYRSKLKVAAAERKDLAITKEQLAASIEKETNGTWKSAPFYTGFSLDRIVISTTGGCKIHDARMNYYDNYDANLLLFKQEYAEQFLADDDNAVNVGYTSKSEGKNIALIFTKSDADGSISADSERYIALIDCEARQSSDYGFKITAGDVKNNLYKLNAKTGTIGAKVTDVKAYDVDNVFYIVGVNNTLLTGLSSEMTESTPSKSIGFYGEKIEMLNKDTTEILIKYSARSDDSKGIRLDVNDYNDGDDYNNLRSYIPVKAGDEQTISITAKELRENLERERYNEETDEYNWVDGSDYTFIEDSSISFNANNNILLYDVVLHDVTSPDFNYSVITDDEYGTYAVIEEYCGISEDVVIPETINGVPVKKIAYDAFSHNKLIKSVQLSSNIKEVYGSFEYCTSLETVKLNEGLKNIDGSAFYGCDKLKTINIPSTVEDISDNAFGDTPSLDSITVASGNDRYTSSDGVLYRSSYYYDDDDIRIDNKYYTLVKCPETRTAVTINSQTVNIGEDAFRYNKNIKSIVIPDNVEIIESYAFDSCTSLESVTLGKSLRFIYNGAFSDCKALKSITIPDGIVGISTDAFENCTSLSTVTFGKTDKLEDIYRSSFRNTPWYDAKVAEGKLITIGSIVVDGSFLSGKVTVPEGMTKISSEAFSGNKKLTGVTLPSTLESIQYEAFYNCPSMKSVTIPASVKLIDDNAFGYYILDTEYDWDEYTLLKDFVINCYKGTAAVAYAKQNNIKYTLITPKTTVAQSLTHDGKSLKIAIDDLYDAKNDVMVTGVLNGTGYKASDVYAYKVNVSVSADLAERIENREDKYFSVSNRQSGISSYQTGDYADKHIDFSYDQEGDDYVFMKKNDGTYTYTRKVVNKLFVDEADTSSYLLLGSDNYENSSLDGVTINSVVLYDKDGKVIKVIGKDITKDKTEVAVKITDPSQINNEYDLRSYLSSLTYDKAKAYLLSLDKNIYLSERKYTDDYGKEFKELGYSIASVNYPDDDSAVEFTFTDVTSDGIIYNKYDYYNDDVHLYVVGCKGEKNIAIPSSIGGVAVTGIDELNWVNTIAFGDDEVVVGRNDYDFFVDSNSDIDITIPESVKNIYLYDVTITGEENKIKFVYKKGSAAEEFFTENGSREFRYYDGRITWGPDTNEVLPAISGKVTLNSKLKDTTTDGITLTFADTNGKETVVKADKDGNFNTEGLADGNYYVSVRKSGFVTYRTSVKLDSAAPSALNISLSLVGDVNNDNDINMKDLTRLQQYLANWDVDVDESCADVTADEKVNMKDLTRLQQYLANWDVKLESK